jgi:hypothetical protein
MSSLPLEIASPRCGYRVNPLGISAVNHTPKTDSGSITILRQIENQEAEKSLKLKFLSGQEITLTDLVTGAPRTAAVGKDGEVRFTIPNQRQLPLHEMLVTRRLASVHDRASPWGQAASLGWSAEAETPYGCMRDTVYGVHASACLRAR